MAVQKLDIGRFHGEVGDTLDLHQSWDKPYAHFRVVLPVQRPDGWTLYGEMIPAA